MILSKKMIDMEAIKAEWQACLCATDRRRFVEKHGQDLISEIERLEAKLGEAEVERDEWKVKAEDAEKDKKESYASVSLIPLDLHVPANVDNAYYTNHTLHLEEMAANKERAEFK